MAGLIIFDSSSMSTNFWCQWIPGQNNQEKRRSDNNCHNKDKQAISGIKTTNWPEWTVCLDIKDKLAWENYNWYIIAPYFLHLLESGTVIDTRKHNLLIAVRETTDKMIWCVLIRKRRETSACLIVSKYQIILFLGARVYGSKSSGCRWISTFRACTFT